MTTTTDKPTPQNSTTCPVHPQIHDDLILVKYQLGVREAQNGERKEQINHAWKRINTVGNKAEQEDKTLREDIDDVKEDVNTIKGELKYIGWFVKIVSVAFLIYIAYYILRPELGLV